MIKTGLQTLNSILARINVSIIFSLQWRVSAYLMCMRVCPCVFIPRDRVILRYYQCWIDSSEPASSHSAVPHTQDQECYYLPLHRAGEKETEQNMCRFIYDAILTYTPPTHTHYSLMYKGLQGTNMVISHSLSLVICCKDKSVRASITHPVQQEPL